MRIPHRALTGILIAAVAAGAAVFAHPGSLTALPQHGQAGAHGQNDAAVEHFHAMVEELELTEQQRDQVAAPFQQAFTAMQELHLAHEQIAAVLTESQRQRVAEMMHGMIDDMHRDHGGHGGEAHH